MLLDRAEVHLAERLERLRTLLQLARGAPRAGSAREPRVRARLARGVGRRLLLARRPRRPRPSAAARRGCLGRRPARRARLVERAAAPSSRARRPTSRARRPSQVREAQLDLAQRELRLPAPPRAPRRSRARSSRTASSSAVTAAPTRSKASRFASCPARARLLLGEPRPRASLGVADHRRASSSRRASALAISCSRRAIQARVSASAAARALARRRAARSRRSARPACSTRRSVAIVSSRSSSRPGRADPQAERVERALARRRGPRARRRAAARGRARSATSASTSASSSERSATRPSCTSPSAFTRSRVRSRSFSWFATASAAVWWRLRRFSSSSRDARERCSAARVRAPRASATAGLERRDLGLEVAHLAHARDQAPAGGRRLAAAHHAVGRQHVAVAA